MATDVICKRCGEDYSLCPHAYTADLKIGKRERAEIRAKYALARDFDPEFSADESHLRYHDRFSDDSLGVPTKERSK